MGRPDSGPHCRGSEDSGELWNIADPGPGPCSDSHLILRSEPTKYPQPSARQRLREGLFVDTDYCPHQPQLSPGTQTPSPARSPKESTSERRLYKTWKVEEAAAKFSPATGSSAASRHPLVRHLLQCDGPLRPFVEASQTFLQSTLPGG